MIMLKSRAEIGAVLNLTGETRGNASVSGFKGGFASNADKILLNNLIDMSYHFLNGAFQLSYGGKVLTFGNGSTTSDNYIEKFDTEDRSYKFTFETDEGTINKAFINSGGIVSITEEELNQAIDFEIAGDAALSFEEVTSDVCIDMSDLFIDDHYDLTGIKTVMGNAGDSTLIGSNDSVNSYAFYGGAGDTTIISGRGNDTMYGYTGTNKTGSTSFVYFDCQGNDLIKDFNFGTSTTSDRIWASLGIKKMKVSGDDIEIYSNGLYLNRSDDHLTVNGAKNEIMRVTNVDRDIVLELGDTLKYDASVDIYGDVDHTNNSITIDSSVTEAVSLVLAGNESNKYWNVTKVDATDYRGNATLIGATKQFVNGEFVEGANCELRGGAGRNSLWGGIGNDTLVGGSGKNTFFYFANGDGDDIIQNAHRDDVIQIVGNLDDVDLDSLNNVNTSGFTLKMSSGGSLTVSGTDLDQLTLKIGDTRWKLNSEGTAFSRK